MSKMQTRSQIKKKILKFVSHEMKQVLGIFEGILRIRKIALNHKTTFYWKIKQPKSIPRPVRSFIVKKNHIGSAVSEIFRYRQKKLTTL